MALPYLYKYIELLNCPYDIIFWDRRGLDEDCGAETHFPMRYLVSENSPKIRKLIGYLKFGNFAAKVLRSRKYSSVVLLTANVSVLLSRTLLKLYPNKYLVDIRDYFMEHNKVFYHIEKRVIDKSAISVISSSAYQCFLPAHPYVLVHNTPNLNDEQISYFKKKRESFHISCDNKRVVLSYIGGVRFFEQDKKVIDYFSNDNRFEIRYIGSGAELLSNYVEKNNMQNVVIKGRYKPTEAIEYYADTDLILNLYGNGTPLLDYALSNKLYYAATLEIPILVCPDTYMEEVAVGNGFGFAVDLTDKSNKEKLLDFYENLDRDKLHAACQGFLSEVSRDNNEFNKRVKAFFSQDGEGATDKKQ